MTTADVDICTCWKEHLATCSSGQLGSILEDFLPDVKILCLVYSSSLPNLVRLQTEKFLVLPTKSWNDTNTCCKFTIFLDDKIRATVQLITYIVPQNCLSMFTVHKFTINARTQPHMLEDQYWTLYPKVITGILIFAKND